MNRLKTRIWLNSLMLLLLSILLSCTDDARLHNPDACENDYYSELLGNYQGRVKAELWTSEIQTELRNRCEWEVNLSLWTKSAGSGSAYCTLFTDVDFTLLSQQNMDQGSYTCANAKKGDAKGMGFTNPYKHDFEFQKAPIWPIDYLIGASADVFHPFSTDPYEYITPLTGQHVTVMTKGSRIESFFYITKRDDGGISFVNGRANYDDLDNFFPADPNVSLTGVLIKQ